MYRPPTPSSPSNDEEDEESGETDIEESDNENDSNDEDDEDADENGNLRGFVVNDEPPSQDPSKNKIPKFNSDDEFEVFMIQTTLSHFLNNLPELPKNNKQNPDSDKESCDCEEGEPEDKDTATDSNASTSTKRKKPTGGKVKPPLKRTKVDINESITNIDELIAIIDKYEDKPTLEYTINMTYLKALKEPLIELKNLIGLQVIKKQILDQIMYLLSHKGDADQMLHTAIYGSAGSGKTTIAQILAKIYRALGYSNGKFRAVKASELIAGYVGQTAIKTQKVIDEARGGVLFIDEAYSLASGRNDSDGFSKEAIDCLNQNLTERKTEFICIIAGYKQQMEECFFSFNPGLNRRFPFRYHIESYTLEELYNIFHIRIAQSGWTIDPIPIELFKKYEPYLTQKGGDMENLAQLAKLAFSRRTFGKHQDPGKHLSLGDIQEAFKLFLNSDEVKKRPDIQDTNAYFEKNIRPTLYV
jgi:SpoVK/Ycf46/Vps4 family AAA+-type ATPase